MHGIGKSLVYCLSLVLSFYYLRKKNFKESDSFDTETTSEKFVFILYLSLKLFGGESQALASADILRAPRLAKQKLSWPQAGTKPLIFTSHCSCLRLAPVRNRGESVPRAIWTPQAATCSEWYGPERGLLGKMIKVYGWQGKECVLEKAMSRHLHRYLRRVVTGLCLGLVAEPRNPKAWRTEIREGKERNERVRARF